MRERLPASKVVFRQLARRAGTRGSARWGATVFCRPRRAVGRAVVSVFGIGVRANALHHVADEIDRSRATERHRDASRRALSVRLPEPEQANRDSHDHERNERLDHGEAARRSPRRRAVHAHDVASVATRGRPVLAHDDRATARPRGRTDRRCWSQPARVTGQNVARSGRDALTVSRSGRRKRAEHFAPTTGRASRRPPTPSGHEHEPARPQRNREQRHTFDRQPSDKPPRAARAEPPSCAPDEAPSAAHSPPSSGPTDRVSAAKPGTATTISTPATASATSNSVAVNPTAWRADRSWPGPPLPQEGSGRAGMVGRPPRRKRNGSAAQRYRLQPPATALALPREPGCQ